MTYKFLSYIFKENSIRLKLGYVFCVITVVATVFICSLLEIYPYHPEEMNLNAILSPPFTQGHFLGTDYLGRDILSRLMYGTQAYVLPGLLAVLIAIIFGSLLGVMSTFSQRRVANFIKFSNQLILSMPRMVLLLLFIAIFEADIYVIMVVIGISNIPSIAQLIAGRIDLLKSHNFIQSSIATGIKPGKIIFKHILWYNCRIILVNQTALAMAEAVLMETSLSYLGFGVQEPIASWGNMVQAGSNYFLQGQFWSSTLPALAIMLVLSAFYLLSHTVNQVLEQR